MNVGELIKERDRLVSVIEEGKTARVKLRQVNQLIALYGDDDHIAKLDNVRSIVKKTLPPLSCGKCGQGPYKGRQGVAMHNQRMHGGDYKIKRSG